MRILLVEDDDDLAEVVALGLRQEHFAVDRAATFDQALDHLLVNAYDVVCLDLGLPDRDGLDLCNELQHNADLIRPHRILMLTARDAVEDRVAGLDDYLVKPFTIAELTARLRALLRRQDQHGGLIVIGDLIVDVVSHRATRGDRPLALTGREFAVLRYFSHHVGELVSAENLLEHCWDANADSFSGSERVILSRLRKKLGDPPLIETVKGVGYRIEAADQ